MFGPSPDYSILYTEKKRKQPRRDAGLSLGWLTLFRHLFIDQPKCEECLQRQHHPVSMLVYLFSSVYHSWSHFRLQWFQSNFARNIKIWSAIDKVCLMIRKTGGRVQDIRLAWLVYSPSRNIWGVEQEILWIKFVMLSNKDCDQADMDLVIQSWLTASSRPRPAACSGSNSQVPCGAVEIDHGMMLPDTSCHPQAFSKDFNFKTITVDLDKTLW